MPQTLSLKGGIHAANPKTRGRARTQSAAQEVRIIGGSLKRSKLAVVDTHGLRPTPNRVRETLFNWLGASLEGWHCLDMFAGTGALGIEAASRGASRVVLMERQGAAAQALKASVARLKADACEVLQADALNAATGLPAHSFDIVFVDPPFDAGLHLRAALAARPLLKPGGLLYIEAPDEATLLAPTAQGYTLHKQSRAAAVWFGLLILDTDTDSTSS